MTLIRNVVLMNGHTIHFMQKYGKLLKGIPVKLSHLEHWNHCNVCFRDKEEKFSHNYYQILLLRIILRLNLVWLFSKKTSRYCHSLVFGCGGAMVQKL